MTEKEQPAHSRVFFSLAIAVLIGVVIISAVTVARSENEVILGTSQPKMVTPSSKTFLGVSAAQQAELRVDIRYTRAENISLSVGFRRLADSPGANGKLQVTEERIMQIFKRGQSINGTNIPVQAREHMTSAGVQQKWTLVDFGFRSTHFPPTPQELIWVLWIEDHNENRWHNDSGELSHERGCLEWFNITIGDIKYVSQLHPVFVAGMICEATISGCEGEIYKIVQKSSGKTPGIHLAAPSYHEVGSPTIGVASVVGIEYFKYTSDLDGNEDDTDLFWTILSWTTNNRWKIYYLNGDEDDVIDDGDTEWMMEKLDWETGGASQPDLAVLWTSSHGGGGQGILSSNSKYSWWSWNNKVSHIEAADRISAITNEDVKLFWWMSFCYSRNFWSSMHGHDPNFHHEKVLGWSYHPKAKTGKRFDGRELWAFQAHMDYTLSMGSDHPHALEWMYSNSFTWDYDGNLYPSIRTTVLNTGNDLIQLDYVAGDQLTHLAPNTYYPSVWSMTTDCRTRGSPSQSNFNGQSCSFYRGSNWAIASEITPYGTFDRFVGFWFEVETFDKDIWVQFDGRAQSTYYGSSQVTNLDVVIYSAYWANREAMVRAIGVTYSTDSGLIYNLRIIAPVNGPVGDGTSKTFYVFICYQDGWSANWGQWMYFRNVKIIA